MKLSQELVAFRNDEKVMIQANVCDSNEVEYIDVDGASGALVESSYFVKKGSKELLVLLKQERQHTLFQQTEQIRKRGEEASTRLLFPMLLLLLVAMLFVMVPAFFQVM